MDKTEKIWLNGKLVDWEDAKVHVLAHALNYGTGVFEGIRVYHTPKGMAIFRLKDHVQRMMDGCKIMGIDLEFEGKTYGFDDICNAIKDVVLRETRRFQVLQHGSGAEARPGSGGDAVIRTCPQRDASSSPRSRTRTAPPASWRCCPRSTTWHAPWPHPLSCRPC